MRVLIVHYNASQGGGAESAIQDQTKALEGLGHEVKIEHLQPERAYVRWKPDIIHFHTIHVGMSLEILQWAQGKGIPHVLSLHDYWPFCSGRMLLAHEDQPCAAVAGKCDGACDGAPSDWKVTELVNDSPTVTFNPYSAHIMEKHGVNVTKVIPHGIDTDYFSPGDTEPEVMVMTSSAWPEYPTKGMHVLKEALVKIKRTAMIVAHQPREVVRDELRKHAVFVFPSCYEETFGLCLTEAMACGCACVASDVCGPRYQIEDGDTGLLVPPRSSTALAGAIEGLFVNHKLRRELGQNARAWAESCATLERMGKDYEELYEGVIRGNDRGS